MAPALARDLEALCCKNTPTWKVCHSTHLPHVRGATPDSIWIAKLREIDPDCEWLIVTKDYASTPGSKESERLPDVCKSRGHAYVIMSGKIKSTEDQKVAIVDVWKQFETDVLQVFYKTRFVKGNIRLCRQTGKKGRTYHQLQYKGQTLPAFLKGEEEKDDSFHLEPI
jgi:hypothetical protein